MNKHILPEGWRIKDGFLEYPKESYSKHVLFSSGKLDRELIVLTLENWGYKDIAARWSRSPVEMAADDLLMACKALLAVMDTGDKPQKLDVALTWRQNDDKPKGGTMPHILIQPFSDAKQAIYDHVGFKEDRVVYPIDDRTAMLWKIVDEGRSVRYAETQEEVESDGDYYEDEIYTQRFYSQWIYRGPSLTMIFVDTHTDGNKFFAIYENLKEV